jgi:hypothetical protein
MLGRIFNRRGPRPLGQVNRVVGFIVSNLLETVASLCGAGPANSYVMIIMVAKDGGSAKTVCLRAASSDAIWLKESWPVNLEFSETVGIWYRV